MHIFEVTAQVSTLGEGLLAEGTDVRSVPCVLPEVVPQVAALLKDTLASGVLAFKIQLYALCSQIFDLDCLMPLSWKVSESFRFDASDLRVRRKL